MHFMRLTDDMKRLIKEQIARHGWHLAEFTRQTGMSSGTAQRIYHGDQSAITDDNAAKLCSALKIPVETFWRMSRGAPTPTATAGAPTTAGNSVDPELAAFEEWLTTTATASDQQFILELAKRMGYQPPHADR